MTKKRERPLPTVTGHPSVVRRPRKRKDTKQTPAARTRKGGESLQNAYRRGVLDGEKALDQLWREKNEREIATGRLHMEERKAKAQVVQALAQMVDAMSRAITAVVTEFDTSPRNAGTKIPGPYSQAQLTSPFSSDNG